jgi:hypothetical protein
MLPGLDAFHVHDLDRALGAVVQRLRVGPAIRRPALHRLLHRAGVLASLPEDWPDSPRLEAMPWGAGRMEAPPPNLPEGFDGPWPQAPLVDPDFYPPVLRIEQEERRAHIRNNASRYLGQVVHCTPRAAFEALRGPRLRPLDDATFVDILTGTSFGQFVTEDLEEHDREAFGPLLGGRRCAKIDLSLAPEEHALPGVHVAPAVVLLEREPHETYRALAIRVGGRLVLPCEGPTWEMARYFALQGAQVRMTLCTHPRLHFPSDVLRVITRSVLPAGHLLHRLLVPHTELTAGLHEAVIHHRRSTLHNSQREIYNPFPYSTEGTHAQMVAGHKGIPGRRAYAPYRFGDGLFGDHVPYGRFRRDWYELYLRFAAVVLSLLPPRDPHVRAWADHIHAWLPSFPDGEAVARPDHLASAAASYLCTVSVYHSADHHSYAAIPIDTMPWRLRAPPPAAPLPGPLDLSALVLPEDAFRHRLWARMFLAPVVIQSLRQVRYAFDHPRAREAARDLEAGMDALDGRWAHRGFPSSAQMASSLQY